jgi:hypothetical protein
VINYDTFVDENGYLNIVGFLGNTGKDARTVPMIKLKLLDKQGETTYKFNSDPLIHFINPGSVTPFKITVMDASRSKHIANFKISFDQKTPTQPINPKPDKLAIENIRFATDNSGVTRIEGDIRNDGSKATDTFTVVVAFMNGTNHVLDVKTMRYGKSISTGARMNFKMEFKQPADKYCLVADSRYYVANPYGMCEITEKRTISKPLKDATFPRSSTGMTTQRSEETQGLSNHSEKSVELSKFRVLDTNKTKLSQIYVGQEIQLQSKATNNLKSVQPFTYIVQIKNQEEITVMLDWVDGRLSPNKQSRVAVQWLPEEPGKYTVQTFVWKSLEDPSPLTAQPIKTSIEIKNKKV